MHITARTLSFGDFTYNLHSNLKFKQSIPENQFGEIKQSVDPDKEEEELDQSEDEDVEEVVKEEEPWMIQEMQAMSMTSNIIAIAQKNHSEFCFIVKPAPGSRRINIVGYQ